MRHGNRVPLGVGLLGEGDFEIGQRPLMAFRIDERRQRAPRLGREARRGERQQADEPDDEAQERILQAKLEIAQEADARLLHWTLALRALGGR